MCSTHFNIFALALKFRIFTRNFKISFIVYLSIVYHYFSIHCSLPFKIPRRATTGSIWNLSDGTVSGDAYPRSFIQCVIGREIMDINLWLHGLDVI